MPEAAETMQELTNIAVLPAGIKEEVRRFVGSLPPRLKPCTIVVFGSQASGSQHHWSDVDLAVSSTGFQRLSRLQRKVFLQQRALASTCLRIEPIGCTPRELAEGLLPTLGQPALILHCA